eukprot:635336-Pleurochrysis_carterae.AAC.2
MAIMMMAAALLASRRRSNDDATLFNCAGDYQPTMTLDEIRSAILPTSGEWILYKRPQLNQITEGMLKYASRHACKQRTQKWRFKNRDLGEIVQSDASNLPL